MGHTRKNQWSTKQKTPKMDEEYNMNPHKKKNKVGGTVVLVYR